MLELAIKTLLDNTVTCHVSPLRVAEIQELPYVTYEISRDTSEGYVEGGQPTYRNAVIEIGVFGSTFKETATIAETIRSALDQYGETISGIEFAPIWFDEESETEETIPEGQEFPVYVRVCSFRTLYKAV